MIEPSGIASTKAACRQECFQRRALVVRSSGSQTPGQPTLRNHPRRVTPLSIHHRGSVGWYRRATPFVFVLLYEVNYERRIGVAI
jgi:hypothetical protein